jgi:hypothetical protein
MEKRGGQLSFGMLKLFAGSQKGSPALLKKPCGEGLDVGKSSEHEVEHPLGSLLCRFGEDNAWEELAQNNIDPF